MIQSHERNINPFNAAEGFMECLCLVKANYQYFFFQLRLTTSRNCSSPEDVFRLLISSTPLLRIRLLVSWDLANLGKSSCGIWPFLVVIFRNMIIIGKTSSEIRPMLASHLLNLLRWKECGG